MKTTSVVLGGSTGWVVPRTNQHMSGVTELGIGLVTKLLANVAHTLVNVLTWRKFVSLWAYGVDFVDRERAAVMRCTVDSGKCKSEKEGTHCCGLCVTL